MPPLSAAYGAGERARLDRLTTGYGDHRGCRYEPGAFRRGGHRRSLGARTFAGCCGTHRGHRHGGYAIEPGARSAPSPLSGTAGPGVRLAPVRTIRASR